MSLSAVAQTRHRRKNLMSLWRARILKLYRKRTGHMDIYIRDDEDGRAILRLLLACDLPREDAAQLAPWVTAAELAALASSAHQIQADPAGIGEALRLTDAERTAHRLWSFRPVDVPWAEVQRRQAEQQKVRERERRRMVRLERRARMAARMAAIKTREDALMFILLEARLPMTIGDLVERVLAMPPLRSRPSPLDPFRLQWGRLPSKAVARALVHRTVNRLKTDRLVKTWTRPGKRGLPERLVAITKNGKRRLTITA